jgi:Phage integrase, N-terminal SAM-like domain
VEVAAQVVTIAGITIVRRELRVRHMSLRTEQHYVYWIRGFVRFHHLRHPREMGAPEVECR